jgi:uncharacterized membrane protein
MKNKVILILTIGIISLLTFIVIGDFLIAVKESRPVDDSVINLLQITITGLIGIIGTYFGMSDKNKGSDDN